METRCDLKKKKVILKTTMWNRGQKPFLKSFDSNLQEATLILIFFQKNWIVCRVGAKRNKTEKPPPPFFSKCPKILFSQIHVPRYMEFCFFFKSMYPGTWTFVSSSNPCTVHGILFFLQIQMNLRKQNLGTFWKKVVGGGSAPKKISVLFRFLPTLKNNLIFWKKSKSRCSSTDKKWENKVERVSILMGHPVYHQKPSVLVLELFRSFSHFFLVDQKNKNERDFDPWLPVSGASN